jgi:hypothetical protein
MKGLFTTPSDLSAVPEGAMERAENIVIDAPDKGTPRRGFDDYGSNFGASSARAKKIFFFGSTLFVHHGTSLSYSTSKGAAFTTYSGSFSEPESGQNMTTAQMNRNLYFTTSDGVKKIDSLALQPKAVGVPKAIHFDVGLNSAAGGFLVNNYSVACRVVWAYRDTNGNLIMGAPSQVQIIKNTSGGNKNVDFIVYIPSGITASHFMQIYRSVATTAATPSLEMALIYERVPSAAELTAGIMGKTLAGSVVNASGTDITDIADDAIRGAFLYSSPSMGGSVVANDQPPLAKVIGRYKSYLMYLNTVSKYRLQISLLGTGTTGTTLKIDDTITIGSLTYTAKSAENVGARQFKVTTSSGLASEDIRLTCLSLCKVVNQDASAIVYGFYLSDALTTPGQLLFEERGIGSSSGFGIWTSVAGAFSPSTLSATQSYTAQTGGNTITPGASIPENDDTVILSGNTAGGLSDGVVYWVHNGASTTFQLSRHRGSLSVTISDLTDLITFSGFSPTNGDIVTFTTVEGAPLASATTYYVVNASGSSCKLSLTSGGAAINITAAGSGTLKITVPVTSNGSGTLRMPVPAKNETSLNRMYWSKSEQPEAVPLLNYRDIGSADKKILIAMQLRESFIVLKEDGCYRVSQEAPFQVDLIDSTQQLIGPDTAVVLNNGIYALTSQGIIVITEGGAQVIDLSIEKDILSLFGSSIDTIRRVAFAVAYETDRKYILFLPSNASDTFCQQAIVYNTFTRAWTRWTLKKTCGIVHPSADRLILGSSIVNSLDYERKKFDFSDYVDYASTQTINSQTGSTIQITGTDTISIGDLIYQSDTVYSFVQGIDPITGDVTLLDPVVFTPGSCRVYSAIQTAIKWTVQVAESPAILKHFSELVLYYKRFYPGIAYGNFSSDLAPGVTTVELRGDTESAGWGLFGWGMGPWGGDNYRKPLRILVPREQQRCSQLSIEITHAYAFGDWELQGLSLLYNPGSSRIG